MSVHDLRAAAHQVDSRTRRSRQRKLGVSDGDCLRRAAYRYHRVEPSNDAGDRMKMILGTWLHKGALDVLRREYGALTEVVVEDDLIRGHVDAVYPAERLVEDIKSVGLYAFESLQSRGRPRDSDVRQVMVYTGMLRAGAVRDRRFPPEPVPVDRVRLRYVCRNDGAEWLWETPFDPAVYAEVRARFGRVVVSSSAEDVPRDHDGPGLSYVCDSCPFRDRCWPPYDDGTAPQARLLADADIALVAGALAEYDQGRRLETEGKELKARARAVLDGTPPGRYGPWRLSWAGGNPGRPKPDIDAMIAEFEAWGLPVPMAEAGRTPRSIAVSAVTGGAR